MSFKDLNKEDVAKLLQHSIDKWEYFASISNVLNVEFLYRELLLKYPNLNNYIGNCGLCQLHLKEACDYCSNCIIRQTTGVNCYSINSIYQQWLDIRSKVEAEVMLKLLKNAYEYYGVTKEECEKHSLNK